MANRTVRNKPAKPHTPKRPKGEAERMAERRLKVWQLRVEKSLSVVAIAKELKISNKTAWLDLQAVAKERQANTQALAALELQTDLARIDAAFFSVMPQVQKGDLNAVNAMTRLIEQRAKLLGYYAPTRFDLTTNGQPLAIKLEVVQGNADAAPEES